MSVLIKGMDMPKRCVDCPIYFAGLCSVRLQNGKCPLDGRPDWCPLEEVPVPHGRLIDAEAFKEYISKAFVELSDEFKIEKYKNLAKYITEQFCLDIDEEPTVIEEEQ